MTKEQWIAKYEQKAEPFSIDDFKTNMRWTVGISITATGILVTVVEHFWR